MATNRREWIQASVAASIAGVLSGQSSNKVTRFVRFERGRTPAYGLMEGDTIRVIRGALFGDAKPTGESVKLSSVRLLYPLLPPKVLAVGLNYKSHIGSRTPPSRPEIFYKPTSCLQDPGGSIVIPSDAKNVHFEGELVLVIGKTARKVTPAQAKSCIFGVTCGNDVSERDWQNGSAKDLQWWRAKGADTFGPLGPCVARGLDYGNLALETRLNGKVVQKQTTADLLFDAAAIVSQISQYVTLVPGDVIYTGTPGSTSALKPGDLVEVEIQGIGVLRNTVVSATT